MGLDELLSLKASEMFENFDKLPKVIFESKKPMRSLEELAKGDPRKNLLSEFNRSTMTHCRWSTLDLRPKFTEASDKHFESFSRKHTEDIFEASTKTARAKNIFRISDRTKVAVSRSVAMGSSRHGKMNRTRMESFVPRLAY